MTASTVSFGRKSVILAVIISVAAMFVTSFVYRMNNPNLFVQVKKQQGPQQPVDHDHDGDGIQDDGPNAGKRTSDVMGQGMGGSMGQIREFMAAVEANPNDTKALVNLGNAFLMMRAWDRALEPLQKANEIDPGNIGLLKAIGIVHFNKQEFQKAADVYKEILEIEPNDSLALFNSGVIYKHYFEKPDEARTYFEKVIAVEKDDQEIIKMAKQELE
ncbi:tetratricopeptide repeat protein [Pseudodesulfovibrio sp. zrk46]|uniref:tetratricopeptide repeat protein n=1 Tax=Pseudodesulfovibrio sp. zrk46 TaxID=2725288 RepID=UPI0014495659|nr:tetratricopeptide repeat protein [Pseudodesulfovibrio sp. zrk46]QJB57293.1 tetratricopeptide repeat protein [Pseudodesulfovibrio sp. zrk46]